MSVLYRIQELVVGLDDSVGRVRIKSKCNRIKLTANLLSHEKFYLIGLTLDSLRQELKRTILQSLEI